MISDRDWELLSKDEQEKILDDVAAEMMDPNNVTFESVEPGEKCSAEIWLNRIVVWHEKHFPEEYGGYAKKLKEAKAKTPWQKHPDGYYFYRDRAMGIRWKPVSTVTLNVREIIRFFDESTVASLGHVSSICGVMGEDMGIALIQHYLKSQDGVSSYVLEHCELPLTPKTGSLKGPRLDRWLLIPEQENHQRILFQVEIKNWSATAIGGEKLAYGASVEELEVHAKRRWDSYWDVEAKSFRTSNISKVLTPMKMPVGFEIGYGIPPISKEERRRAMIIFWTVAQGSEKYLPFFEMETSSADFPYVSVFSMSGYLRSLRESEIDLEMPCARRRLEWLDQLLKIPQD